MIIVNRTRCADILTREMAALGMRKCFSVSGNHIMAVYDAAIGSGLDLIHTRHEAAAVHMADAWGRLTGEPGVALVTAGPGFANCMAALYVAKLAESPVVLLSGDAATGTDGRGGFQELDQVTMSGPVTKRSWRVIDPTRIREELTQAVTIAKAGRPGPVHLSLPVDVLEAERPVAAFLPPASVERTSTGLAVDAEREVIAILITARRPLLIAGPAVQRTAGFRELQARGNEVGLAVIGAESPRGLNDPSLGALADATAKADVVVLVGKSLDHSLNFGATPAFHPQCRFLQIDADSGVLAQARRNITESDRLYQVMADDLVATISRCIEKARIGTHWDFAWPEEVRTAVDYRPQSWRLKPGIQKHTIEVLDAVKEFLQRGSESIFVSDGGEFGQWAQACIGARRRVINGPSGAIGGAIPFAIGARAAFPEARIVTVSGDGAFGFHALEFDTALRYGLPFIAVVGNDAGWNAEIQIQIQRFGKDRAIGCELLPTRYDKLAEAMGCYGHHAESGSGMRNALDAAWNSKKPSCIDVKVGRVAAPTVRKL
jgi:acetolactate synthase-1/2/3 large subunit